MFMHIFFTRFKCLIRSRQLVFWSLIFPIALATLFKIAFANLSSNEIFQAIDIAVVDNQSYQECQGLKGAIESVSANSPGRLFNVIYTDEKSADELLKNSKIEGYIYLNPEIQLVIKSSGLKATVIKTFLDNYKEGEGTITEILKTNPGVPMSTLIKDTYSYKEYTKEISPTRGTPDTMLNYFYTVIAMACLFGGFMGLKEITDIQGNLSKRAARVNMAPVHKLKVFIYGIAAAFLIQLAEILILLAYLCFALKIDFGNQLPYILLLCFAGCAAGISFGTMLSAWIKKGEGVKIAILIAASNVACFLAGMQYANMKYIVQKNVPILAYLNPAALITDGFYTLYYYNSHERFYVNTAVLIALSIVFCTITYLTIRRQKYASI